MKGDLDVAIRLGVVKQSVIIYCQIYHEFKKERESGKNYVQAVEIVAERLCHSEGTIRRAVAIVI
jgi:hypothetical protein